jgi:adenylosuccinate synthase
MRRIKMKGHTTVVVDSLWGDSGKGKIAAHIAWNENYDLALRAGTGTNAGHSMSVRSERMNRNVDYRTNQLPLAGIMPTESGKMMTIGVGSGVCVDPEKLKREMRDYNLQSRVVIDWRCPVILPEHKEREASGESYQEGHTGSTKSGTGEARVDYVKRVGVRWRNFHGACKNYTYDNLRGIEGDVAKMANTWYDQGKKIVIEGSQGHYLSLYLSPEYPVVTSDNCTVTASVDDVGLAWNKVDDVCMIIKSAPTRVSQGCGDLPGEISKEEMAEKGIEEFGVTTGRQRRKSLEIPFDLLEDAVMINAPTYFALTFCDHVDDYSFTIENPHGLKDCIYLHEIEKRFPKTFSNIIELQNRFDIPVKYIEYGKLFNHIAEVKQ